MLYSPVIIKPCHRPKLSTNIYLNINFQYDTRSTATKEKKLLCFKIYQKVKRQSTKGEKVFTNYVFHKGLVSRIYKEWLQFNNKKTTKLKNGQKIWTDNSPKNLRKWSINTWNNAND